MDITSKISIVLPAYNERKNLEELVPAISGNLKDYTHEIIVVDDNSPDGTADSMKRLQDKYPQLELVVRTQNRGFANSIRAGLEKAKGDILIVMDSDFNHRPEYLSFMISNIKFYDCVSASRFLYGGTMDSRWRHSFSWIFNIFVRIMTGGKVTDSLYGYFALKREVLNKINYDDVFWGYGDYCIRLMYLLQKSSASILQFPAINGERIHGEGNTNFFKVFNLYFRAVIKLAWRIRILKNV